MSTVAASHIRVDDEGVAWIHGTQIKVVELATDKLAHGWSPEEMHFQHPHLSLAQIHAALAYYYDHQADLDAEIERRLKYSNELAEQSRDSALRKKLLKQRAQR